MTLTVGGDKISRLTLAGNEFLNAEDAWQKCMLDNRFSGTPVLMKYDAATGVSSFLGQSRFMVKQDEVPIKIPMLTLPEGYHFTAIDTTMYVTFNGQSAVNGSGGDWISAEFDGRTVWMDVLRSPNPTTSEFEVITSFGSVSTGNGVKPKVWQTTTVAPD